MVNGRLCGCIDHISHSAPSIGVREYTFSIFESFLTAQPVRLPNWLDHVIQSLSTA